MESFLTTVSNLIREKNLPALMIGGHAVTALGHPRATYDLDLLIPRTSLETWKTELQNLHFRNYAETKNFAQFEPDPDLPLPPIDLMIVEDSVFLTLSSSRVDSPTIPTPSVLSLIALKLHAISQPSREDTDKDWSDIFSLMRANDLSLDEPGFSATLLKHGGARAVEKIRTAIARGA